MAEPAPGSIANWLFACCALVFAMVIVGAVTRLTESGLSIAEWKPLLGTIPPLNDAEWARVFELYQQTPEFQKKNFWMEMDEFKRIFFWEWLHRFLGRIIGIVYALPLVYFWLREKIPEGCKLKLLVPFILGGLQGAMGWYMVQSGLVDIPAVSHYRLAAHLSLAFLILCVMFWLALSLKGATRAPNKPLFMHGCVALAFLIVTITWGAFTAGLDGGLIYNETFPKMGGEWIPPEAQQSILASPAGVQFLHRWLAILTLPLVLSFWAHGAVKRGGFPVLQALGFMILLQAGLGIATLLSGVNLMLAVLHQAGALTVLILTVVALHRLAPAKD
ncbi:MAG: COX15/CtaA family protein [Alphaproteobacteria bacterium]